MDPEPKCKPDHYSAFPDRPSLGQSGSTVIVALIGIALVGLISLVYANIFSSTRGIQRRVDFLNLVAQIQLNIANTANDAKSWTNTINDSAHNPSMACIAAQSCTTAVGPTRFVLWPAGATSFSVLSVAVYDGTNPSAGYTLSGQPCTTFSMTGNSACPVHVNLTWSTPGCAPAPCVPAVTITADVQYRGGATSPIGAINENLLKTSFVQKSAFASVAYCTDPAPPPEVARCASPPYPGYRIVCTPTGFRCGRVYN